MVHKPSPSTSLLKDLRMAHSLSQNDVAEAIETNANTVSRWERGIATPSPYYRRKLAELFGINPQELFSDLNDDVRKTTTVVHPPEPEAVVDLLYRTENGFQGHRKALPAWLRGGPFRLPKIYIPVASVM